MTEEEYRLFKAFEHRLAVLEAEVEALRTVDYVTWLARLERVKAAERRRCIATVQRERTTSHSPEGETVNFTCDRIESRIEDLT